MFLVSYHSDEIENIAITNDVHVKQLRSTLHVQNSQIKVQILATGQLANHVDQEGLIQENIQRNEAKLYEEQENECNNE